MQVLGICGWSGSGKTTLAEALIPALKAGGRTVSVIKHTHKDFEMDVPGKDSWRHSQAGAGEVLLAARRRVALFRELAADEEFGVHELLALLPDRGDHHWVLVEGFKYAELPRLEVWRAALAHPPLYPKDAQVMAIASTDPPPMPTDLPWFDLNDVQQICAFLLRSAGKLRYEPSRWAVA